MEQTEWDALSVEEQEKRIAEKPQPPEPEEDYIMVSGKKRPLKNFLAERDRDLKADILREIKPSQPAPQPQPKPVEGDWHKQILSAAEREMAETGNIVPINTIVNVGANIARTAVQDYAKTTRQANSVIKSVKRELRSQYKNFNELEEKFDEIIDNVEPSQINKDGLVIIFKSLMTDKLEETMKEREDKAREDAIKETKIIGNVETGKSSTPKAKTTLTQEQQKEMNLMGFESEESYLGRLTKYQEIAKSKAAKNIPKLLSEQIKF